MLSIFSNFYSLPVLSCLYDIHHIMWACKESRTLGEMADHLIKLEVYQQQIDQCLDTILLPSFKKKAA